MEFEFPRGVESGLLIVSSKVILGSRFSSQVDLYERFLVSRVHPLDTCTRLFSFWISVRNLIPDRHRPDLKSIAGKRQKERKKKTQQKKKKKTGLCSPQWISGFPATPRHGQKENSLTMKKKIQNQNDFINIDRSSSLSIRKIRDRA